MNELLNGRIYFNIIFSSLNKKNNNLKKKTAKSKEPNWTLTLTCGKKIDFDYIDEELEHIKNTIYSSSYKLVCCHNDINAENIIFDSSAPDGSSSSLFSLFLFYYFLIILFLI